MALRKEETRIVFGPVPSRRLGRSLGINNIPFKHCTYSCVYCQLGKVEWRCTGRNTFYTPERIYREAKERLAFCNRSGEKIDYLTLVADGEPTLDERLSEIIDALASFGLRIAILTNGSLLCQETVQEALFKCDLVSLKLDAGSEKTWRAINRPPETFAWEDFEVGMRSFAQKFAGRCITETMVLRGMNDSLDDFEQVGTLLQSIHPDTAYLAIPTRPPAEDWVRPPDENRLFLAYQIFSKIPEIREVQFLVGDEGNDFVPGEDPLRDLLAILAVHPMREEAMEQYLDRIHSGWDLVCRLMREGEVMCIPYQEQRYYVRRHRL